MRLSAWGHCFFTAKNNQEAFLDVFDRFFFPDTFLCVSGEGGKNEAEEQKKLTSKIEMDGEFFFFCPTTIMLREGGGAPPPPDRQQPTPTDPQ